MLYTDDITPPKTIIERAKGHKPLTTLVVGASTPLVLESVKDAADHGLISPVLLGDQVKMKEAADAVGYNIDGLETLHAGSDDALSATLVEAATRNELGAIMKGQISTDRFMAGLLDKSAGLRTGSRMTHAFHMSFPGSERSIVVSDAALNVAPDEKTFQAIVRNSVGLVRALGNPRPKVGVLSATEKVQASMPTSQRAADLTAWARDEVADADFSGPLALDNAISPKAAALKGIDDPVSGHADILIVPNIETGNALFKAMVYFAGACAAGLVLGGRLPVILTSRSSPPAARLTSAALAQLIQASSD